MAEDRKKPWGSTEMKALLGKLGIKTSGDAMSTLMELDFASRDGQRGKMQAAAHDLAILRLSPGDPEGANPAVVKKLTDAILKEYEIRDRKYQPEAYTDAGAPPSPNTADFKDMEAFKAGVVKTRTMLSMLLGKGKEKEANALSDKFADQAVKSGFWKKSKNDLIQSLHSSALAAARKNIEKAENGGNVPMRKGKNGIELPASYFDDEIFKKDFAALMAAYKKQDGKGVHDAIDELTQGAVDAISDEKLNMRVDQKIIKDFFFTADQQAEMRAWDNAPDSEYSFDWQDAKTIEVNRDKPQIKDMDGDSVDMNNSFNDYLKLSASDVKKTDMKTVAKVYDFGEDDVAALESFTLEVVKKGPDNAGVQKSAKDLIAASKKKKKSPKAKNGRHLAYAMFDAVRKAMNKQKVTKPMKESEIV